MQVMTQEQKIILYVALSMLSLSFLAALIVTCFYLIAYPDRMLPFFALGFLQAIITACGFIIGTIMGVHLPGVGMQQAQQIASTIEHANAQ